MKIQNVITHFFYYFEELHEKKSFLSEGYFSNFLFLFGSISLFFLFSILFYTSITFAIGGSLTSLQMIMAIFTSMFFCFIASALYLPNKQFITGLLLFIVSSAAFLLCTYAAGSFYDLSYDGQWYHQDLIVKLAEGWNPFYQHLTKSDIPTASILNTYPKAAEIFAASFYRLTHHIELSKVFNFWLVLTAFSLSFSALLKMRVPAIYAFITALLLTGNPVTLTETISYYNDGQVYSLMLCLLSILALAFYSKKSFVLLPLFCVICLLVHIKLTAILFSLIFVAAMLGYCWYSEKIQVFAKIFLVSVAAYIVAFVFMGFNPYITNIYYFKEPFYPAAGKDAFDFVKDNAPENYRGKNSAELLVSSLFAESDFLKRTGKFAKLKIPFTYTNEEVNVFVATDPIEGGFGPLFSGAFIIALLIIIYSLDLWHQKIVKVTLLTVTLIVLSSLMVGASFYVRYIPQFWMIPCLLFLLGVMIKKNFGYFLSFCLLFILIINNGLILLTNVNDNLTRSNLMHKKLAELSLLSHTEPLRLNFGDFRLSNRLRFQEAGINFIEEPSPLTCPKKVRLLGQLVEESLIITCETSKIKSIP